MKREIISLLAVSAIALSGMARQPQRGYRGFIDWSNSVRTEDVWGNGFRSTWYYTGFSTTHGYQIDSRFFVGIGFDLEHCSSYSDNMAAVFVDGRTDLKFGKFTPFGDLRVGFSMTDGGGLYFSPTIGYRFNWGRKVGVNIGAGLTLKGVTYDHYDIIFNPDGYVVIGNRVGKSHEYKPYFTFRVGFDF